MCDLDAEEDAFLDTAFENVDNFSRVWNSYADIESFLHRTAYICVRGTSVAEPENDLEVEYDIDGVSIRWKDVSKGLELDYTHLVVAPTGDTVRRLSSSEETSKS